MWLRIGTTATLLAGLFACETETPCTRFADYVCTCHADDPDFSCEEVEQLAQDPSQSVADQCAEDLADLQAEDSEDTDGTCDV